MSIPRLLDQNTVGALSKFASGGVISLADAEF